MHHHRVDQLPSPTRRQFLLGAAALGALACQPAFANIPLEVSPPRELALKNLHTGESVKAVYWENGQYQTEALLAINHTLRDHRSNEVQQLDLKLLDLLCELQNQTANNQAWEVISAYRSQATNDKLRKTSSGVARKSFHCLGKAMDVRLPGTSLKHLHQAALATKSGGVGYYPKSGFIHVDTGPVRRW